MLKKIAVLLTLLGMAFGLMLLTTGESRFEVQTSAPLHVPPTRVWQVLAAVGEWSEWWPGVEEAQLYGSLVAGSEVSLRLKGVPTEDPALLTKVDVLHELTWERPGVLGSRAGTRFLIEVINGGSRLTVENFVQGPQAFLARITGKDTFIKYQQEILKSLQEKLSAEVEKD